jgi:putative transcriptional regulator
MSKKRIYTMADLKEDRTDWAALDAMTEEEIHEAALSDPDAQPLTEEELSQFKRVHPPEGIDVQELRRRLGLSQALFAHFFGVSKRTVQEWEQGRKKPSGPAQILLGLISAHPTLIQGLLSS